MASFVLGIVGLALLLCGWVIAQAPSLILGILAIIFGQMAKGEIAANPELQGEGKAKAGFIMGIIATAIAAVFLIAVILFSILGESTNPYYDY